MSGKQPARLQTASPVLSVQADDHGEKPTSDVALDSAVQSIKHDMSIRRAAHHELCFLRLYIQRGDNVR